MKAALVCLFLFGAAVVAEERLKRSLLGDGLLGGHGLGWGLLGAPHGAGLIAPSVETTLWGPAAGSILGIGHGLGWAAAPALAAPVVAAPVAAAPAVVAPAVGHGRGNIGPIAGEAIIRGPSGTVHSPAIQAGLH